ncbi:MAG: diacylglycerol kinase family protein [Candidatus Cloacimonetes bacterium]|jgi:diacylglycerol kinase family enzyme|nr:diacylglycerol kinase family protein [Candidatus Cloacimonadota bacterium]
MIYVLFNALANNGRGEKEARAWADAHKVEGNFVSVVGLDVKAFFDNLKAEDEVILTGGDGTVNHFANDMYGYEFKNILYYAKCGCGNDFYKDVEAHAVDGKVDLRPFIKDLPLVTVNGISRRFVNGIGYGIDGDTCLVGDNMRKEDPNAVIDYTKIAIGLLLGKFNTKNAVINVDGKESRHEHIWLASTMFGKYYGGGMMAAPKQDRLNEEHTCTLTTFSSVGRLITLFRFPTFSSGKHDKKKFIKSYVGHNITVTFDAPCALQIDGEVIPDVTTYSVHLGSQS